METLEAIIKPQLLSHYKDWIMHANQKEKKGLKIISQILANKGRKKIKNQTIGNMLKKLGSSKNITLNEAQQIIRKSQTTTTYHSTFGYLQRQLKPQNNIFKFKKLNQLDIAEPLKHLAVQMISNWVQLNDQLEYQQQVLTTLRSLYSRYKTQQISKTQMKHQYTWNIDWDLAKPIRIDKAGSELKAFKPNYQAILKQRVKQEKIMQKLKELEGSEYAQKLKIFKHFKIT